MNVVAVVSAIRRVPDLREVHAERIVNVGLSLWKWVIGTYIHEQQQNGPGEAQRGAAREAVPGAQR